MPYKLVKLIIDHNVRKLCPRPYPQHPKGCPNYGRKYGCPPDAPLVENLIQLNASVYAVWNVFPFGKHVQAMSWKHPDWSLRRLECCLYWQGTARKKLEEEITAFETQSPLGLGLCVMRCPEAHGVNVTATMKSIGEKLEWPPVRWAYQVAIVGITKG